MSQRVEFKRRVLRGTADALRDAGRTSWTLFKIMVPISIVTYVAGRVGLIEPLGRALGPVMEVVGLPGEMGLVWATGLVTNLYGAMVVFASLAGTADLTGAQVTVLTTMVLVAHALPVEVRIAQKAGPRARVTVSLRLVGAFVLGWVLHQVYTHGGWLQGPVRALWHGQAVDASLMGWLSREGRNLAAIFGIIVAMMLGMRLLEAVGVTRVLTRLLEPVLRMLGMSRAAAPVTIIGIVLGISYGGGLIIDEARSGRLSKRDVFFSLALMGLCHSLIEDTGLMLAMGGHWSGVLVGRAVFALVVIAVLVRVLARVPDAAFDRHFFRAVAKPTGESAAESPLSK